MGVLWQSIVRCLLRAACSYIACDRLAFVVLEALLQETCIMVVIFLRPTELAAFTSAAISNDYDDHYLDPRLSQFITCDDMA